MTPAPGIGWHLPFLGLLQGITEFVPISSSGHLTLARELLGLDPERNLEAAVLLHAGTLLALLVTHGKDFMALITSKSAFRQVEFRAVLFTTITTAAIYFSGAEFFDLAFKSTVFVGLGLVFTAFLLVYAELRSPEAPRALRHTGVVDWVLVGLLQALAIIPGVSRAGATISGSLLVGLERKEAVRFAFLLAIPAILGAVLTTIAEGDLLAFVVARPAQSAGGFVVSFLAGLLAIRFMLNFVPKRRLDAFAIYCLVLGLFAVWVSVG